MRACLRAAKFVFLASVVFCAATSRAQQPGQVPAPREGDYVSRDFRFKSGETLPELRIHYATFGTPARDANGRVINAVLLLHGTSGTGEQFLLPQFAGVLFGPGQLLDI